MYKPFYNGVLNNIACLLLLYHYNEVINYPPAGIQL